MTKILEKWIWWGLMRGKLRFAALSNKVLRSLQRWPTFHEKYGCFTPLGTHILRNKFHWRCKTYTSIEEHNDVKILPKPSVEKLMVSYNFFDSVLVHAKFVKKNIILDILKKMHLGKSLVWYIVKLFLELH